MTILILGLILFLGVHLVPTRPDLRKSLIGRFGYNGYRGAFSFLSLVGLALVVWGFSLAPVVPVWTPPLWTRHLALVLMIPAFVLVVAAYVPGRIKARLRHPFLVGVKTWAVAHLLANGELAAMVLFGTFLAYAVYDRISLKHRPATALVKEPPAGPGRNDAIALAGGLVAYALFLVWLHPLLIGVSVLP